MTLAEAAILIVDDEPLLRLTFRVLLEHYGATVHTAEDGAVALELLRETHVDVILTDQHMPVMNGTELLHAMHSIGLHVPSILFVSGVGGDQEELCDRYVVATATKPLHPEQLVKLLTEALQDLPGRQEA